MSDGRLIGYTLTATFITEEEIKQWDGKTLGDAFAKIFPNDDGFTFRLTPIHTVKEPITDEED